MIYIPTNIILALNWTTTGDEHAVVPLDYKHDTKFQHLGITLKIKIIYKLGLHWEVYLKNTTVFGFICMNTFFMDCRHLLSGSNKEFIVLCSAWNLIYGALDWRFQEATCRYLLMSTSWRRGDWPCEEREIIPFTQLKYFTNKLNSETLILMPVKKTKRNKKNEFKTL